MQAHLPVRLLPLLLRLLLSDRRLDDHSPDEPPSPIDLTVESLVKPSVAWTALTDPRRVAEWFTDASPVGRIGDAYRLDFGDGSVVDGVIMELEPGRRFAYTWSWAGSEAHEETLVIWSVAARDGGGSEYPPHPRRLGRGRPRRDDPRRPRGLLEGLPGGPGRGPRRGR